MHHIVSHNISTLIRFSLRSLRVFVSTWNVGGVEPREDMNMVDWVNDTSCDIYVLGYVEM